VTEEAGPLSEAGPISVAQEAMFYQCLLNPNARSYHETISIRKNGELDLACFEAAFNEILRRHASWRSTFEVSHGQPVQVAHEPAWLHLPLVDLSGLGEDAEHHAVRLVAEASSVPYDLRRGPLLRPRLMKFADHHRLYLAMHHLIFDVVSVHRVVLPELVAIYDAFCEGRSSPLPELETTYADYAAWEQEWIAGARATQRLEHWRTRLESAPSLSLPLDRRRAATPRLAGATTSLRVDAKTVSGLRALGQGAGATLFQTLAAAWALVLARSSGQDDVVFATAADLRQRPEFESVVGCSISPLVLRVDLSGDPSFFDLVVRTRNEVLDGLDHLVPFERIVRDLEAPRPSGANPIYQTMVVLEPPIATPHPDWAVHLMESTVVDAVGVTKLDLELGLDERWDGSIEGRLIYDRDLFDKETADDLVGDWLGVISAALADPTVAISALMRADQTDRRRIADWNATTTPLVATSVPELIAAQARRRPDAPAVWDGEHQLSYGQLVEQAARTARRLQDAGLGCGEVVALCARPSVELVASALGVLQAGAAYLLLDPDLGPECLERVVEEAAVALVYADPVLASRLTGTAAPIHDGGDEPGVTAPVEPPAAPCCIQYPDPTSGERSGYSLSQRAVVGLCTGLTADLGIGPADTVLVLAETLRCASAIELWMPLSAGARVVLAPAALADDGAALSELISAERVSFLHASATRWQRLVDTGLRAARGLGALSGAVGLTEELADAICERSRALFVGFGGPEVTGYAAWGPVDRTTPLTIGRPRVNNRAYVVDERKNPLPVGTVGELLFAGDGVATPHPPDFAAVERAVLEPGGDGRAVATGFRARWRRDGSLELVPPPVERPDR
jgi:non-ribosomal peptide synthetase component F